jgi:ferrous iron transport protein A
MKTLQIHPMSLADLPAGEQAFFTRLASGEMNASRLASLGFTPGVVLRMMQNFGSGPLVVTVRGTRVALGRQEAGHIYIHQSAQ